MFTSLWPLGRSMPVRIYLIFQLWTLFCTFTDPFLSGYANTANSFLMDLNNGAKRSLKVLLSPGTHCNLGGDWELWVEAASFTQIYFRRTFIKLCYCIFRERHAKSSQLWWLGVWCLSHSNSVVLVWNTNEGNFAWFVCLFVCLFNKWQITTSTKEISKCGKYVTVPSLKWTFLIEWSFWVHEGAARNDNCWARKV